MRLSLIRLVLIPQQNIFASFIGYNDREDWLRSALSQPFTFLHRRKTYHFVPSQQDRLADGGAPIIMGRIGRSRIVKENEPPEAGLEELKRESWSAANFYLDPRHHEDGQKVAMEQTDLGDPLGIVRSMANSINRRYDAPYDIKANPISNMTNFVSFIDSHPQDIYFIQFDLNVPNMFGDRSNVDAEMRHAKERYKAKRARVILASEEGMQLKDDRIRELGSYALEGGGEVKAKALNGSSFSSSKTIETANIELPDEADERTILSLIMDRIFRR